MRLEIELVFVLLHDLADDAIKFLERNLTAPGAGVFAIGSDQDQGGPACDPEPFPDGHVGVIDDRVLDAVLGHLAKDVFGIPLGAKLA